MTRGRFPPTEETGMARILEGGRIRIEKQVVLPFRRAVAISLKSLRIRFWRSLVTTGGIVLAIAFLVSVWTSDAILDSVRSSSDPAVRDRLIEAGYGPGSAPEDAGADRTEALTRSWLVGLSLLVAVIGVVNAMLMAVTERFREIGTMKCLGALDSFVVKLFLLESSFQGAAGAIVGIAGGAVLAVVGALVSLGALAAGPVLAGAVSSDAAAGYGLAFLVGMVLSVAGAVYPALVAARMEPAVALRREV